ncbi:hypothetical protein HMPREF0201_01849 [Cedecea davisae DSM 4568]|uniref:Uncharacterized protein n=1 Tax=Cedecea davisae DSM 4568 TaxID=566551 RepID=S3IY27_9ENTR|nr:hypothetical protein HMPREF0201_01849 [Cedecea davisae DSM 4568]
MFGQEKEVQPLFGHDIQRLGQRVITVRQGGMAVQIAAIPAGAVAECALVIKNDLMIGAQDVQFFKVYRGGERVKADIKPVAHRLRRTAFADDVINVQLPLSRRQVSGQRANGGPIRANRQHFFWFLQHNRSPQLLAAVVEVTVKMTRAQRGARQADCRGVFCYRKGVNNVAEGNFTGKNVHDLLLFLMDKSVRETGEDSVSVGCRKDDGEMNWPGE